MKQLNFQAILALIFLVVPTSAFAGRLSLLLGPPSLGAGGSNPVSIPPANPVEWQASYVTDEGREFMASVIPGLFYGQRWQLDHIVVGLGGGLLVSSNGLGLGLYNSVGWETGAFWKHYRFAAEYRQVIGVTAVGAEFPYTIRIGASYEL